MASLYKPELVRHRARILVGTTDNGEFICSLLHVGREYYKGAPHTFPSTLPSSTYVHIAAVEIAKKMRQFGIGPNWEIENGICFLGDVDPTQKVCRCNPLKTKAIARFSTLLRDQLQIMEPGSRNGGAQ